MILSSHANIHVASTKWWELTLAHASYEANWLSHNNT